MRVKLDENLPIQLKCLFTESGHDAATVVDEGLGRAASSTGPICFCKLESTDRGLTGREAGLAESSAGVPAFAGRRRGRAGARSPRSAPLGGAEGAGARVREACAGMLARASDPGRRCERASGGERYRP